MNEFEEAVRALAVAGVQAELHRSESGQIVVDVLGEQVDGWTAPEGTWVTIVAQEAKPPESQPGRAV